MIPPKLYIPTSTLNFNSIMASESISPASFYAKRKFGYKRFEKVAPNPLENLILLYDKYPIFTIEENGLESYPMVIEIDTQNLAFTISEKTEHIYISKETVYLNPFSVRFIFRTKTELTNTYLRAERSIESKMTSIYKNVFCLKDETLQDFIWEKTEIQDLSQPDSEAIKKDIKINQLKGLSYGYLLAANKSIPENIVLLKKYAKTLQNTLSALISNPSEPPTLHQTQQLHLLYDTINQRFLKTKGIDVQIEKIIKQKSETYKCPNFLSILKKEKLYGLWFKQICAELNANPYQLAPFYSSNKNISENLTSLNTYIDTLNNQIQQQWISPKTLPTDLPDIQNMKIIQIPRQKDFLSKLLNTYLQEIYTNTAFMQDRYTFARKGGEIFKEELLQQNKWEDSAYQKYINSLLRHLKNYDTFDLNTTDNHILKSFSAFCQKGESDINKLEDYLIENEIGDFRIAFALWGMIFGFAEMPKTFTNELFDLSDTNYIFSIYKYIFKQIHNVELTGTLLLSNKTAGDNSPFTIQSRINNPFHVPPELHPIFERINEQIHPKKAQEYYKKYILERYEKNPNENLIKSIKNIPPYPKTKTKWNKVMNSFKSERVLQLNLFENNSPNISTDNKHFISRLNSVQGAPNRIIKRMIANWEFTSEKHPANKDDHIKHFINLCKKESKEPHNELTGFFLESIAQKIEAEIRRKYDK